MKHIYRLLALALVLFAAAACYNQEIEGPQDPDQQQSDFRITASIVKTRVSYQDDTFGGYLELEWEDGDVLFGYIEGEPKKQIELKVDGDPDTDGVATLVAASGSEDALSSLIEGDIVDLVYTGQAASYDQGGSITVDMTSQSDQGKIPACMHARGVVTEDNGSKYLEFHFVSDCAIFEVESLTGMAGGTLSTISITNLFPNGKYTLSDEGFTFAGNGTISTYTYTCGGPWGVVTNGVVTYDGNPHPLLIAVAPNPEANAITVEAKVVNSGTITKSFDYGDKSIAGGTCYVISAQPYVAMTVDGQCFRTVKAAFDHAYSIRDDYPDDNIVTLIRDEIEDLGVEDAIDISYHVTLDLNGCYLSVSDGEFNVNEGGNFTIDDYSQAADGKIYSEVSEIIFNDEGVVTVHNGDLSVSEDSDAVIVNYGTLFIYGGTISSNVYTIDNTGSLTIYGGKVISESCSAIYCNAESTTVISNDKPGSPEISSSAVVYFDEDDGEYYDADPAIWIEEGASFIMEKGTVSGKEQGNAVYLENGAEAIIRGGTLNSTGGTAIMNGGDLTVGDPSIDEDDRVPININSPTTAICCSSSEGSLNIYYGNIISTTMAVKIEGGMDGNIYGGYFESSEGETIYIHRGSDCTISAGVIYCKAGDLPAIACRSSDEDDTASILIVQWPGGNVPSSLSSDTRHEPFIYANCSEDRCAPISAYNSGSGNTAQINICGGYVISKSNDFYVGDEVDDLKLDTFGRFYSNKARVHLVGRYTGDGYIVDINNNNSGNTINDVKFYANPQGDDNGFDFYTPNGDKLTTGPLYYISKDQSSSSTSSQMNNYYFGNFGW